MLSQHLIPLPQRPGSAARAALVLVVLACLIVPPARVGVSEGDLVT
jgi:hypothetical protein